MEQHIKDAFLKHVNKTESCWLWTGSKQRVSANYVRGRFTMNGKRRPAHRVAYELFVGAIEGGLCVCHRCDNPLCVNPEHLFLGTHQDNMDDMVKKQRNVRPPRTISTECRGEQNNAAKLTWEIVREMRTLFELGRFTHKELGERYGISREQAGNVVRYKSWKEFSK